MKWWSGGLLVWALSLPALAQEKVALNTISRVEVKGFTIEISGSKKPSFTTFTMTDPPRLVIDLSEAVFSGVPSEMQVNNGTVTAVKTASYGSEDSAIARVLIGFAKEAETDITTEGDSKLVVRVLSVSEPKVATVDPPTDKEAVAKAEKERLAREKAEAEAVAKVEAERLAAAKVAAAK
ncbi:MAG: AMIN domain-containing protein, partial [Myxococcota bacterium]